MRGISGTNSLRRASECSEQDIKIHLLLLMDSIATLALITHLAHNLISSVCHLNKDPNNLTFPGQLRTVHKV